MAEAWADHGRQFEQYDIVYPVVSRRAGGISLGINLNPDLHCNFDCPYCQVDRTNPAPTLPTFSLEGLRKELMDAIAHWIHNRFTDTPRFQGIPFEQLDLKDLCLSGDGESTMVPQFAEVCELLAETQQTLSKVSPKLVLITNATLLHQPKVRKGLEALTRNCGEIWGKLDAGTEEWFRIMSGSRFTLDHITANLKQTAQDFPLRIQTMLCKYQDTPPSQQELEAYSKRVQSILGTQSHKLLEVQLYTIVRHTSTPDVSPVSGEFLQETAERLQTQIGIPVKAYGV